jgi:integrase
MAVQSYTKDGKRYFEVYVNGSDLAGHRMQWRKRGIESRRQAEELEFSFHRKLAELREEGIPYTWSEWLGTALSRMKLTLKRSTLHGYEKVLSTWVTPHWKERPLRSITREDVFSLVHEKPEGRLTPHSKRTLLKYIKRVLQMAMEEGLIDRNPAIGVKVQVPEVEQKVLGAEEVRVFLKEAKATNHRFYPMWAMALFTGMRSGELFALLWSDVDFESRMISVNKQWTNKDGITATKTRRSRRVPISDELLIFLKERKLKAEDEHVLPRSREWENGEQALVTRGFCQAIGVTPVKFHDLRATFITSLLSRGETLARVMAIVGHTQIKTTNAYLRLAGVEIRGATDRLGYEIPTSSGAGGALLHLATTVQNDAGKTRT